MMWQPGISLRRLARASLCAGLVGALVGCILDTTPVAICGDGYVDAEAEEECDPAADDSPPCSDDCRKLELNCGNGKIDDGEACDGTDFDGKTCQSGQGFLTCNADCTLNESTCNPCGNGELDPGEECDTKHVSMGGGFADPIECASLKTFPLKPYTTGVVNYCTAQCMWYRGPCGYCGDNKADPPTRVDLSFPEDKSKDEWCDGEDASLDRLTTFCDDNCPVEGLRCQPQCLDDCSAFDAKTISSEELRCCVPRGGECPSPNAPAPCCYAYEQNLVDKFDKEAACEQKVVVDNTIHSVCH